MSVCCPAQLHTAHGPFCNACVLLHLLFCWQERERELLLYPKTVCVIKAISSESVQVDLGSISTEDEVLAEPDISGLWNKESYQVTAFFHQVLGRGSP
jgi:hypothetical protein